MTVVRRERLTRAQSQQRTRAAVVAAAVELFLTEGFRTTSLDVVAAAAGYTRGAVYSNFADKAAMGIAVVDELYRREERRLAELIETEPPDRLIDALSTWAEATVGDPRWMQLEIEVAALSGGNNRAATVERHARLRALCRRLIDRFVDESAGVDRDLLALGLVGMALGVGFQRAADPAIGGAQVGEMFRLLLPGACSR